MAVCLLTLGCGAGWHRVDATPRSLAVRQQAQIWQRSTALRWHAVQVTADSVSGIPFTQPTDCDSCRVVLPSAAVDSIRIGNPVAGFWKSVGLVTTGFVGLLMYLCRGGCDPGN